jgi:hypothetical protein
LVVYLLCSLTGVITLAKFAKNIETSSKVFWTFKMSSANYRKLVEGKIPYTKDYSKVLRFFANFARVDTFNNKRVITFNTSNRFLLVLLYSTLMPFPYLFLFQYPRRRQPIVIRLRRNF